MPALASAAGVALTATPANPSPGDAVALVATAPAYTQAASLTQEIVQQFDPTYLRIAGVGDVTAPAGWALSYSTDGSSFSSGAPADWSAVRAVKATGTLDADGASGTRQIAVGTESVTTPAPTPIAGGGGGDGWDVAFDNSGHIFNMFHHLGGIVPLGGPITTGTGALDCHLRSDGTRCPGAWPYNVNVLGLETNGASAEWVDSTNQHVWFPTSDDLGNGFACIDISTLSAPAMCGGSVATGYLRLAASVDAGSGLWGGLDRGINTGNALLAESGGRLYTWDRDTGHLLCVDTQANGGAGAECTGGPVAFPGVATAEWEAAGLVAPTTFLFAWSGRIYGSAGAGGTTAVCIVAATNQACPGWGSPRTLSHYPVSAYREPNADGSIHGACFVTTAGPAECFDRDGTPFAGDSTLGAAIQPSMVGWYQGLSIPTTVDSRVYYISPADYPEAIPCWDIATGAECSGFENKRVRVNPTYTLTVDPTNSQCLWTNSDSFGIQTIGADGNSPCSATPPRVTMNSDVVIPRMGCTGGGGITHWQRFTLTTPVLGGGGGATSATLTVRTADGALVSGWTNVTINPADGEVDLSALDIAASGQKPQFQVDFTGRQPSALTTTATVIAVGEAPSLCITAHAQAVTCPAAYGPASSNLPWTATVTGSGSVTPGGGPTETYTNGTGTVTAAGHTTTKCVVPSGTPTDGPANSDESPPMNPKIVRTPTFVPPGSLVTPVLVPGPGTLKLVGMRTTGGRACASLSRTLTAAGTTELACRLNASTRALLRTRAVCVNVWAIYTPVAGPATRTSRRICVPRRRIPAVTG